MIPSKLKKPLLALIYSNGLLSLCITALAYQTYLIENHPPSWAILSLLFGATISLYSLHSLVRQTEKKSYPKYKLRTTWIDTHKKALKALLILGLIISSGIFLTLAPNIQVFLILMGIISLSYSLPILKWKTKRLRLRDIPYTKLGTIVTVITCLTVLIPHSTNRSLLFDFLRAWTFIAAITLPFDLRDRHLDTQKGLKTIATALSETQVKTICICSLVISGGLTLIQYHTSQLSSKTTIALLVSLIPPLILIVKGSSRSSDLFYAGLLESCLALQPLFVMISHLT